MIVRAPRPAGNFYLLDKAISEDRRLSWGARGLLVYLLGKPDNWRVSPAALVAETSESARPLGRDGVYALLAELTACGYVTRTQPRLANGVLGPVTYLVSETPLPAQPVPVQPLPVQPLPANPTVVSIELNQGLKEGEGDARAPDADPLPKGEHQAEHQAQTGSTATERQPGDPSPATPGGSARKPAHPVTFDPATGSFFGLNGDHFGRWSRAYPAVDVEAEVLRAAAWVEANPANRKSNYLRFITNWLSRAQDKAPRVATAVGAATYAPRTQPHPARRSAADERADWLARATGQRPPDDPEPDPFTIDA